MKNERIARHTAKELADLRRKGETGTDWARIEAMTEDEIERRAAKENEALGIPDDWYEDAAFVVPEQVEDRETERITLRLDREVIAYFRRKEPGYEALINAVLRAYVRHQDAKT